MKCFHEYKDLKEIPYFCTKDWVKLGCHHGQKKLLLSEIQFFSVYGRQINIAIYVGSAPCIHLPILLKLFPNIKFLLVDPNFHKIKADFVYVYQNVSVINIKNLKSSKSRLLSDVRFYNQEHRYNTLSLNDIDMDDIIYEFDENGYKTLISDIINNDDRIYIIQDNMTFKLAETLGKSIRMCPDVNICLISDMRTNHDEHPTDVDYVWNNASNIAFTKSINPDISLFKFHPPYFNDKWPDQVPEYVAHDLAHIKSDYGIDFIDDYHNKKHMFFPASHIWLQAWAPPSSSEARLVVKRSDTTNFINYDHKEWDDRFMYFRLMRQHAYFPSYYTAAQELPSYDGCFDCSLEMSILCNYHDSILNPDKDCFSNNMSRHIGEIHKYIEIIDETLYDKIKNTPHHGFITKPLTSLRLFKINRNRKKIIMVEMNDGYLVSIETNTSNEKLRISKNSPVMVNKLKKILNRGIYY
jgi:hypothetical protein